LPVHTTAATTTVAADDIIDWVYKLPAAYAPRARIVCNRALVRKIRKLKTGTGEYVWQPGLQMGSPNMILDTPYEFSDRFDDGLDASDLWEANAVVAVIGDFSYYWIVDALQMSIQRLNELYAETNQTGYIGRKECDGQAMLAEAFYGLKVKS
jgi:HK97 family phage major capsid protein